MRSDLATAVFGVGLSTRDVCSVQSALEFFNYGYPVAAGCVERLTQQATDWCQCYFPADPADPVTVYLSTVTPDTPWFTVMETSTIETTTTLETTTTTQTTVTTSLTSTVELTSTTTTSPALPKRDLTARVPDLAPKCGTPVCIDPSVSCIDLTEPNLARRPAAKMSEACRCLLPPPTTVTLAATTAAVSTSTTTDTAEITEVETEISVETDVSTVTSTTTAIETAAASVDKCSVRYTGGGNGSGNTVQFISTVTSAVDCCQQCLAKPNCIASAYLGPASCQHLVKITPLAGAETSAQCPLGIEAYGGYGVPSENGVIFAGPCSDV
ncbi:hypothetical protein CONLIGDRAFT_669871 [Coniochaeta ligniaria NRRL 30616]|uniref:Uncharacterized protein n=1 Tax=Coniochaeta ligniaria NRRL 30616 TaxID=1408157 RepID=A0A1J7JLG1_9PEZI|nr:hypothetical protein CONLIGDRAFT_669871 [Coniochaeta ligniaria NRRL 30616]